ncbi:MAG: aldehyde ferredoxin oxidoreductase family protein [Firmicutes bacterium]|nr:aldehyde ferredoxin oxidoreductase family protein [Bacillota bacterium]MDH7494824.1 aldehyde ferredoxin oxidoreductase family protein [Bacillota bacterium]
MSIGGFHGRLLLVDLSSREWGTETVPGEYYEALLGGRGVAARYYYDRTGPSVDPFGEDNELIFFTGPLTGVKIPCGTKLSLSTRSPLTMHYTCSNAGGDLGPRLKAAGYDGLIVRGRATSPVYIKVSEQGVDIRDAADLWGLTVSETMEKLRDTSVSPSESVLTIGPAGERLVRFASMMADDRVFGRGGAGAVMGSKRLKAIVVGGSQEVPVGDARAIDAVVPELARTIRGEKLDLAEFGTSQLTQIMNDLGCYPIENFRTSYSENIEAINAITMKAKYWFKNSSCYRCPIACGQVCKVKEGPFAGCAVRPEYESSWALGGHCGVTDYSAILGALHLCNEYGLDSMTAGYMVGFAMDLFQHRLIDSRHLAGISLEFGDGEDLVKMIEMITLREGLGAELADGILAVLERHPDWAEYAVHVKGMPFAGYDPRAFHGIGLTYGTSSRGACHNVGGWTISDELLSGRYDRYALVGKGELVKRLQDVRAFVDSSGICTNARRPLGLTDKPKDVVLKAVTGLDMTPRLIEIGERIYNLERLCLNREGVGRRDDLLPARMSVPIPTGPAAGHSLGSAEYDVMLDEYYRTRCWSVDGRPSEEKLKELGLS